MFGRIFTVFLNSRAEAEKLQPRYHAITTRLGWLTVALGCFSLILIMYQTWLFFGFPLRGGPIDGMRLKLILWVAVMIAIIPVTFYLAMVVIYGLYGLLQLALGRFTWQEAVDFGVSTQYPAHWYKHA